MISKVQTSVQLLDAESSFDAALAERLLAESRATIVVARGVDIVLGVVQLAAPDSNFFVPGDGLSTGDSFRCRTSAACVEVILRMLRSTIDCYVLGCLLTMVFAACGADEKPHATFFV